MMPKLSETRIILLENLYNRIIDGSLKWAMNSGEKNSYRTELGEYRIDVDKRDSSVGPHVVWIINDNNKVIDRIYQKEASQTETNIADAGNFGELIRIMFETVSGMHADDKLAGVIEALKKA